MADLVGDAYVRIHADTKFMKNAIRRDMSKIGQVGADTLLKDFDKTLRESADRRLRASQRALADAITGGNFDALLKKSGKSVDVFVNDIRADLVKLSKDSRITFKQFNNSVESLEKWAHESVTAQTLNDTTLALDRQNRAWLTYGKNVVAAQKSHEAFKLKDTERAIIRLNRDLDRISVGGGLGRIFGKGSRNDFINLIGSAVGGMVSLTESVLKFPFRLLEKGTAAWDGLLTTFKGLNSTMPLSETLLTLLGTGAKAAIPGLIALAVGIGGLVTVLPALASAASLAAGGLTAIAGAVTFGVLGALLPLVPVVVALAAGIVPLVLGIADLTKSLKDEKDAVKGIAKAWKDFQRDTKPFAKEFTKEVGKWAGLLDGTVPFILDMGDAVLDVLSHFRELFTSKEMKPFIEAWSTTMPIIFDNVGRSINTFLAGLAAFFTPILGFAELLSTKLEDLSNEFLAWASSDPGQKSITSFMEDAWEAASSLWSILQNVAGAIAATFGAGQDAAGQPFLDWLTEVTEKWQTWAESPEGQTALKQWFEDAKVAGEQLFEIIGDIFEFFQELDTEQAREDLIGFLEAMNNFANDAESIAHGITVVADAVHFLLQNFTFAGFLEKMGQVGPAVAGAGQSVWDAVQTYFAGLPAQVTVLLNGIPAALMLPWQLGLQALAGILSRIVNTPGQVLIATPGLIAAALAGVAVALASPFTQGGDRIRSALAAIVGFIPGFNIAAAAGRAVAGVVSSLTHPFTTARDVISRIMAEIEGLVNRIPGLRSAAEGAQRTIGDILGNIGDGLGRLGLPRMAAGGITDGPSIAGEAGREVVIPLERPLELVDPSVRGLAALLRGKGGSENMPAGVTIADGAIRVYTNVADPELVASSVMDRFAAGAR
jgi:hypothetical protein